MRICPHFIGIATLLIGSQLFNLTLVEAKLDLTLASNISLNQGLVASSSKNSQMLNQTTPSNSGFEPPDNGGPDNTQASGTR